MRRYLTTEHYMQFTPGSDALHPASYRETELTSSSSPIWSWKFKVFKVVFDWVCVLAAIPLVAAVSLALIVLNPFLNPGPLFFTQSRAGLRGRPFRMWKFRTMTSACDEARDPNAALEEDRITTLGRVMRKFRIDELPNFYNVARGEMSVVGPRPDAVSHSDHFASTVVGYAERHRVKPGITGLAQVEMGYAVGEDATVEKARYDNLYVIRGCGRLDLYVIFRTLGVIAKGFGAR